MTIASTQRLLESGTITSLELVDRALGAIAARNDQLYAFVEILEVDAREAARRLDAERAGGRVRGPLHGIPLSVKDLYAVKGSTTRAGSLALERRDTQDSAAVHTLREAGAIVLGKTSTHEFAMGIIGPQSRNPHDQTRIAGGSSSGAAIAVATGMGSAALGTDTRGSIRVPAALCGVVGFKPTIGAVSLEGVVALAWTVDHVGVMGASVEDVETVFTALGPAAPRSPKTRALPEQLRVGIPRTAWQDVDAAVDKSTLAAIDALRASGVDVIDVARPDAEDFDCANELSRLVSRSEALAHHNELGLDRSLYTADVRDQLAAAAATSAQEYIEAQRLRLAMGADLASVFERVDALVMPTSPIVAPAVEDAVDLSMLLTRNVAIWSFAGFPAISVPTVPSPEGLPVGLQIVAAPHAEAVVFAVARAVERGVNAR